MRALIPPFGVESVGNMALNLVFPKELGDDAQRGDMDSVCAWLDSGGSVDACSFGLGRRLTRVVLGVVT